MNKFFSTTALFFSLAAIANAAVIVDVTSTPTLDASDTPTGETTYTVSIAPENAGVAINGVTASFTTTDTLGQVQPAGATPFQDSNAFFGFVPANLLQDSQFLFNTGDFALAPLGSVDTETELSSSISGFIGLNGGDSSFALAQIVLGPGEEAAWSFDFDLRDGTTPVASETMEGTIGGVTVTDPMLVGTPGAGPIDLTDDFINRTNSSTADIVASNGGDGELGTISAVLDDDTYFGVSVNGNDIDLTLDTSGINLALQPAGTVLSAQLTVSASGDADGDLTYTVQASVPEPATIGLFGLGIVGLVGLRRRS